MSDSSSPLETLEKQHRKERKELQAKIQALKKSVSKGDKKKKKEVTEESAKLEADLDRKHQEEREQLEKDQGDVEEVIVKVSQTSLDSDQPEVTILMIQRLSVMLVMFLNIASARVKSPATS